MIPFIMVAPWLNLRKSESYQRNQCLLSIKFYIISFRYLIIQGRKSKELGAVIKEQINII